MKIMVRSSSSLSLSRRFRICDCMDTSSADTGSSAMMSLGSGARALAMAILWRCPPENSCGYFFMKEGFKPTRSMIFTTASIISFLSLASCGCL